MLQLLQQLGKGNMPRKSVIHAAPKGIHVEVHPRSIHMELLLYNTLPITEQLITTHEATACWT